MEQIPVYAQPNMQKGNLTMSASAFVFRDITHRIEASTTFRAGSPAFTLTSTAKSDSKAARDRRRGVEALGRLGVTRCLDLDAGVYAWTPAGSALALAIRNRPTFSGDHAFRLFDLLAASPPEVLAFLCNLPRIGTVPEFGPMLMELGITRVRSRTLKTDLVIPQDSLIEFFAYNPKYTPHPSLLVIPEGQKVLAGDRERLARFHETLKKFHAEFFEQGVEPMSHAHTADFDLEQFQPATDADAAEFDFGQVDNDDLDWDIL